MDGAANAESRGSLRGDFGAAATVHGAAGWRMNGHALRFAEALGFVWCSDSRGTHPFLPIVDGETIHCPQLPTTLPTLDELIGVDGICLLYTSRCV